MNFIGFARKAVLMGFMVCIALCMGACSSENGTAGAGALKFDLHIVQEGADPLFVVPGQDMVLEYSGENIQTIEVGKLSAGWTAEVDYEASKIVLNATAEAEKEAKIEFEAKGGDGTEQVKELSFYNLNSFNDPNGAFVLNEGNMTTENGSLGYITPEGEVEDNVYRKVNGSAFGNYAEDLWMYNGKFYIVGDGLFEPNGEKTDGELVIVDAVTLKLEKAYQIEDLKFPRPEGSLEEDEMLSLSTPFSNIAVLDEKNVFFAEGQGMFRFDTTTGELNLIEGAYNFGNQGGTIEEVASARGILRVGDCLYCGGEAFGSLQDCLNFLKERIK